MKRWVIPTPAPDSLEQLIKGLSLSDALARVLANRGLNEVSAATAYLQPQLKDLADPFELPNMRPAVERLYAAIEQREPIVIYGDYDVDGVTSSALLGRVLTAAGGVVRHFLPRRLGEGYGLSDEGIARCIAEHQPRLLIAADCGTSSADQIDGLCKQGIDVIVLDHHEPSTRLPRCVAVVNPKLSIADGKLVPGTPLASVGVAFKLAHALLKLGRERGASWATQIDLREHLDLVAVGTVADLVPLTIENRTFVKAGLDRLTQTNKVGLQALIEVAGLRTTITPYDIGFRLGPRLNAAGRLADAMTALELLLTDDMRRAREIAAALNAQNAERQEVQEQMVAEAWELVRELDLDRDPIVVLSREGWHPGVVGIVASRILQGVHRPTIIIGIEDGVGKGSCRSISGFSMVAALDACSDLLIKHGGHEMAAGITIEAKQIDAFRQRINEYARRVLPPEALQPRLAVDAEVPLKDLDFDFLRELQRIEPCGIENPSACFMVRRVALRGAPRIVGGKHLRFELTDGNATAAAIWWNRGDINLPSEPLDVAFTITLNEYQGIASIQLMVRDIRVAE